tara:strand:- start:535 stop:819 length:285 start_codon:yes stop_codon:yes gene_type:complete
MKNKHEWRESAEDGEQVYYRVIVHAGRWEFFSTRKSDPEWEKHEMLPLEKMVALRDIMWNKHLRRRVALKHIDYVDELIAELRLAEPELETPPE